MTELHKLIDIIADFRDRTFSTSQRNPAIVKKLREEVDELIAAFEDQDGSNRHKLLPEYADCLILLLDSLRTAGFSMDELISASFIKMEINNKRSWGNADENGIIRHIKEGI